MNLYLKKYKKDQLEKIIQVTEGVLKPIYRAEALRRKTFDVDIIALHAAYYNHLVPEMKEQVDRLFKVSDRTYQVTDEGIRYTTELLAWHDIECFLEHGRFGIDAEFGDIKIDSMVRHKESYWTIPEFLKIVEKGTALYEEKVEVT